MDETNVALICKALSDETRLKIIRLLTGKEKCACVLLESLNITQPTLSHHMKVLSSCGLVKARRQGKWVHYSLCCDVFGSFRDYISALGCGRSEGGEADR